MCACEPGFVCSRCADTPDDPRRDFEPEPADPWEGYPGGVELPPNYEPDAGYLA